MVAARQNPLPPSVQVQLGPFPRRRLQGYVRSASAPGADRPDHLRRLRRPLQNGGRQRKRALGVRRRVACRTSSRLRGSYASAHPPISQWRVSWLPFGTYTSAVVPMCRDVTSMRCPLVPCGAPGCPRLTEAVGTDGPVPWYRRPGAMVQTARYHGTDGPVPWYRRPGARD